ncbi:MAG: 4-hydroxy-tetrahydrodipicolinate reductase [Kiritimatiellia bacterium]
MTRIAICGAGGRMGQMVIRCASEAGAQVTAAVEQSGHASIGKDAGITAGIAENGVTVSDDMETLGKSEAVIDFTFHTAVPDTIRAAARLAKPVVVGTTGLNEQEQDVLRSASSDIPIVWAPNMSLGVNLLFDAVRKAASALGKGYSALIRETHHVHKKDAPSGTAIRLGQKIAEGRGAAFDSISVHNPENTKEELEQGRIVIESRREGEVVGLHTVTFENEGEKIQFAHEAHSRDAFALGAIHAARWIVSRPPGLYDMQDVLGL